MCQTKTVYHVIKCTKSPTGSGEILKVFATEGEARQFCREKEEEITDKSIHLDVSEVNVPDSC